MVRFLEPLSTRRSLYLLCWGVTYFFLSLASYRAGSLSNFIWGTGFGLTGILCIFGSVGRRVRLDIWGYTALVGLTTIRAMAYVVELIQHQQGNLILAVIIWIAISYAHYIVSGWPDAKVRL